MLIIIALGLLLAVALGVLIWGRARLDAAPLGSMSERWLAECRASGSASPDR